MEPKLRLGRTLRTAIKRTQEANRLADLNANNVAKLKRSFLVVAGLVQIVDVQGAFPTLRIEVTRAGAQAAIRLGAADDIACLRDFLNEHFPPPAKRRKARKPD